MQTGVKVVFLGVVTCFLEANGGMKMIYGSPKDVCPKFTYIIDLRTRLVDPSVQ